MSQSESSNNKFPPPDSFPQRPLDTKEYIRHTVYYFEDGSTVFLAGGFLFKLQASLLKADPDTTGYRFKDIMEDVCGGADSSPNRPGASDLNPVVLPVKAAAFSRFLLAILGKVGDPEYIKFLTAAQDPKNHHLGLLVYYLDIGLVASYFGMKNMESWSLSQIRLVLQSAESLAAQDCSGGDLERLFTYLQTADIPDCQHELLTVMQLVLCAPATRPLTSHLSERTIANHQTYISFYKTPHLATSNLALFGLLLAIVLSLGHRSSAWSEHLTREDRTILFAAHADLTKLCDHSDLELAWLTNPAQVKEVCSRRNCSLTFSRFWANTFAQCKSLNSPVPLEDINQILTLPKQRFLFANLCADWRCQSRCAQRTLDKLDASIRGLFCSLAKKHEFWAKAA